MSGSLGPKAASMSTRRLTDLIESATPTTLNKLQSERSRRQMFMESADINTRFLFSRFMIDPKTLILLSDPEYLNRYKMFAAFKPPFCPMKKADRHENYHKVCLEDYVDKCVQSAEIFPVVKAHAAQSKVNTVNIRILNDLDLYSSGPVLVSFDSSKLAPKLEPLHNAQMVYDVMVYGELKNKLMNVNQVPLDILYDESKLVTAHPNSFAESTGVKTGFYNAHPVTLVRLQINSPPTAAPPNIRAYVDKIFKSFIVGDPDKVPKDYKKSATMVPQRGDLDFSRVFEHLRSISITVPELDMSNNKTGKDKVLEWQCLNCFDDLLVEHLRTGFGKSKIGMYDGFWTNYKGQAPPTVEEINQIRGNVNPHSLKLDSKTL